jgi:hypothetical protein
VASTASAQLLARQATGPANRSGDPGEQGFIVEHVKVAKVQAIAGRSFHNGFHARDNGKI